MCVYILNPAADTHIPNISYDTRIPNNSYDARILHNSYAEQREPPKETDPSSLLAAGHALPSHPGKEGFRV